MERPFCDADSQCSSYINHYDASDDWHKDFLSPVQEACLDVGNWHKEDTTNNQVFVKFERSYSNQKSYQEVREQQREPVTKIYATEHANVLPFDTKAEIRADDHNFLKLVNVLRESNTIPENDILADRLTTLFYAYKEDFDESLDTESLRTFISFMTKHPELKRPIITATPYSNIYAEWKGDEGRKYLGVQFLPTGEVRYVGIRPRPDQPQRIRCSGLVPADQLFAEISSLKLGDWAGRS